MVRSFAAKLPAFLAPLAVASLVLTAAAAKTQDPCVLANSEDLTAQAFKTIGMNEADQRALANAGITLGSEGCVYIKYVAGGQMSMSCRAEQVQRGLSAICEARKARAQDDQRQDLRTAQNLMSELKTQPLTSDMIQRYNSAMESQLPAESRQGLESIYKGAVIRYLAPHTPDMQKNKLPPLFKEAVAPWSGDQQEMRKILGQAEQNYTAQVQLSKKHVLSLDKNTALDEVKTAKKAAANTATANNAAQCQELRQDFKDNGCRCGALTSSICNQIKQQTKALGCPVCP